MPCTALLLSERQHLQIRHERKKKLISHATRTRTRDPREQGALFEFIVPNGLQCMKARTAKTSVLHQSIRTQVHEWKVYGKHTRCTARRTEERRRDATFISINFSAISSVILIRRPPHRDRLRERSANCHNNAWQCRVATCSDFSEIVRF